MLTDKIATHRDPNAEPDEAGQPLMAIAGTGTALTEHRYAQDIIAAGFHEHWEDERYDRKLFDRFFSNVEVETRHFALPIEEYPAMRDFTESNSAFLRVGTELGEAAVRSALDDAGLSPTDVDAIFFTTVTGVAVPTIDARLINRLGFRSDVKRFPFFGLGCVAGVAGVARMSDFLKAWPDRCAILLAVELCSLTLQKEDLSIPAIVSAALFGDGAAAVVGLGRKRAEGPGAKSQARPVVKSTRSVFYPDTERVMGWDIGSPGFQVVLSADVPAIVENNLRSDVDKFLFDNGLAISDIASWVCHPGGPAVIRAMGRTLGVDAEAFSVTRESLRTIGNLSSASVLFVLEETLRSHQKPSNSPGMMIAMGPGFCSELVLFEW